VSYTALSPFGLSWEVTAPHVRGVRSFTAAISDIALDAHRRHRRDLLGIEDREDLLTLRSRLVDEFDPRFIVLSRNRFAE
jgi:hypothetical protein